MSQFKNDAKCSFIYFLIFIGTLMSCFGSVGIWHALNAISGGEIGTTFFRPHDFKYAADLGHFWRYDSLRNNLAVLFIAFPFLFLMIYIAQVSLHKESFTVSNPFRRWIIYGGLAIGAIFVFHALYQIVEHFLGGTLIRSTLIDSGVLILVVGFASIFFLIDVSRHESNLTVIQKSISILAAIGFVASIYVGLSHNKTRKEVKALEQANEQAKKSKSSTHHAKPGKNK